MKKLFALLLILLPLTATFVSCSDDDDLPDVSLSLTISNAEALGDTIYVVQGDTLKVDAINITNNEQGKTALITHATYNFLGFAYERPFAPFAWKYATSADVDNVDYIPVGKYPLNIVVNIAAEGKSLAFAVMPYIVQIVATPDDIPAEATSGLANNLGQTLSSE